MITKDELLKNYNINEHFQIPCCIVDNPKLDKMLTGEGARVAKELSKEYITIEATYDKENKYQVFKIAEKINANPDVYFFTCVSNRYSNYLTIEGSQIPTFKLSGVSYTYNRYSNSLVRKY